MFTKKARRLGLIASAAAVATLAGGSAYASLTTVSATATDTIAVHGGGTFLPSTGGVETPILQMQLPQGKFVLTAAGNLVNFGPSDYTRCQIVVNGTQIAATSAAVGDSNQPGNIGPSDLLSTVNLVGGATVGTGGALATLQCEHDNSNGAQPYFDNVGSMWAHRTGSLLVAQGGS
jgi:hypothetical protein